MKTFFAGCLTAAVFVTLSIPQPSLAYKTTSQSARSYGETTALFTITYRFGFLNRELYMPVQASRGLTTARDAVGYELMAGATTSALGSVNAMVLSTAEIKDGMYYLPEGKAADFTFVGVLTLPAGANVADYKAQLTALPFVMVDNGQRIKAQLNPSELQYYKTPTAGMNAKLFSQPNVTVTGITYTLKSKE